MTVFALPEQCAAILFDMDSTLYTHGEYARTQIDLPVARLAKLRGMSFNEMSAAIDRYRKSWAAEHGGRQLSLGNAFAAFGVSIAESVQWRRELYQPERYLARDPRLRAALERLSGGHALAVVTNNPVSIARRTLAVLGVDDLFAALIGLDTCGLSKPHETIFRAAAERCGAAVEHCVSVGDRYDIDIALPLEMGMGGILVDGVQDVYTIPAVIE
jgi:phosphoglycolate phosphatase/putative hydrolase of the HAD superfamily